MIDRNIKKLIVNSPKSTFLIGPRQTGKSTLLRALKPDLILNLADYQTLLEFQSDPQTLRDQIDQVKPKSIFIDEIQKAPFLLDTVQSLIDENKKLRFYLSGSSARKLKRGQANLLPGRTFNYYMGPIVTSEMNYAMDSDKVLRFGSLPEICTHDNDLHKKKLLSSYSETYIKEEIQAEALVRSLDAFTRFFFSSFLNVGEFLDYSKFSKKAKISRHICPRYFQIFEDTLVGSRVFPFEDCIESADLIKHPKFYFFDNGVYNSIQKNYELSSERIGILCEQLIHSQISSSCWSRDLDFQISSFRTRGGLEIDFIIKLEGDVFAVEIKHSDNLFSEDVRGLKKFSTYYHKKNETLLLHFGKKRKKIDGVWCLPWQEAFKNMGL